MAFDTITAVRSDICRAIKLILKAFFHQFLIKYLQLILLNPTIIRARRASSMTCKIGIGKLIFIDMVTYWNIEVISNRFLKNDKGNQ